MNNKAFTVIELIITFIIVMTISMGLFKVVDSYREKQQIETSRKEVQSYKNELLVEIENDVSKKMINNIESIDVNKTNNVCSGYDQGININFKTGELKRLCIKSKSDNTSNAYILYGDKKYVAPSKFIKIDNDYLFDSSDEMKIDYKTNYEDYENEKIKMNSKFYKINIIISHEELEEKYYINIVNPKVINLEYKCFVINDEGVIITYNADIPYCSKDVVIPNAIDGVNVVEIGNNAFSGMGITSLDLRQATDLKEIDNNAFSNNKIKKLIIPSNITNINGTAFYENEIISLDLSEAKNLNSIGYNAFENNQIIENLTIPSTVQHIGYSAFSNQKDSDGNVVPIRNLIIENYKGSYEGNSFGKVQNITINSGKIPDSAFSNNKIKNISFGDGEIIIGAKSFENNQITELTIPSNVSSIGESAFSNQKDSDGNIVPIKNLVVENFKESYNCGYNKRPFGKVESITINSGNIPEYAFMDNSISNLVFGKSGNINIGSYAFAFNPIKNLTIPSNVDSIGASAFWTSDGVIENVTIEEFKDQYSTIITGTVNNLTIKTGSISSKINVSETLTLGEGVTSIGDGEVQGLFEGSSIKELVIPSTLKEIGYNAFKDNQIAKLDLSHAYSLKNIKSNAFYNNKISGTLIIPANVINIEVAAFENNQISELDLSKALNLESIGMNAFKNNQLSGKIEFPSELANIGDGAFQYNKISELIIPESVTNIGNIAFSVNPNLTTVNVERSQSSWQSYVSIGKWCFGENNYPTFNYECKTTGKC